MNQSLGAYFCNQTIVKTNIEHKKKLQPNTAKVI